MELKTRRALLRFILLGLAALALWLFAHDFVAQNINHRIATEQLNFEQGAQHKTWDVNKPSDLVAVFAGHKKSAHWLGDQVGFSLTMPAWPIVPRVHDLLILDFSVSSNQDVDWAIEFSDLQTGRFYMASIQLPSGTHELQLDQLTWRDETRQAVAWQHVPRANTMVIRGFADQEQRWTFGLWQLKQNRHFKATQWQQAECQSSGDYEWSKGNWRVRCSSNNAMVKMDQNISQQSPDVSFQFETFFNVTSWMWLIVFIVLLCWACAGYVHAQLAALNGLFLAVVILLIIPELMGVAVWLALPLAVWQGWQNKSSFIGDQKNAWLLWLLVIITAVVVGSLGVWRMDFISQWPMYILWAMFQQLLMIGVFNHLSKKGQMPTSLTIVMTALLFALFHIPNHFLMLMTLFGGLFWMWVWSKYQNLILMIISHSLWAVLLYQAVGEVWLHSARVGLSFM